MSQAKITLRDLGHGRVALTGTHRDQFKRVYDITSLETAEEPRTALNPTPLEDFWTGERSDGMAMLAAFAEAAWLNGWRPTGLAGSVAGLISGYKLPPEEGPTDQQRRKR
jgi:hypothetical protein